MPYTPDYDTAIDTRTIVEKLPTIHRVGIDWNYPFDDPEHWACLCCNEEGKAHEREKIVGYLRTCEKPGAVASNYGGWPRIWHRVFKVCMASHWPYWTPRPTVIVEGPLGLKWVDWRSLTGAETRG